MKQSSIINTKFILALIAMFVVVLPTAGIVYAQDEYPREYTNPNEIVAFDKSTSYVEAIEVINQFLQEYKNKFIIDQTGTSGNIGVSLPAMHWEDALKYILRLKSLGVRETDDYIEIVPLSELAAPEEAAPVQAEVEENELGIDFTTREIRINATFFEGNKRALQEIGVDWSTLTNNVPENLNEIVAGDGADPELGVPQTEFFDQFVSVNSYNASNVSQNVFNALVNLGEIGPGISVQALFSAFESDNLGDVLATPSVKVMDGQEGRIQVGQDFSIKQRDIAGNVTDNFFSTGTILLVTPTVVEFGDTTFIHLELEVERSSAQPDAVSTIINKQQASTQALLLDGEATTIAGLYRTEETKVRRGVPILKDLPPWFFGLRYLFGYNSNDFVENELIILVQAELEESLETRLNSRFKSKGELLSDSRAGLRADMDRELVNEFIQSAGETVENASQSPVPVSTPRVTTDEVIEVEEQPQNNEPVIVEEPIEEKTEQEVTEAPNEVVPTLELTKEQEQLAKELSLPIDNPELMVVVPSAFSLNEYLEKKANGEVEEEDPNERFYIIGGSFIVKNYANRFNRLLSDQGYDTKILFHPESRFNYVAYKGFSNFEAAVEYLRQIRGEVNSEAWLFTKPN